MSQRVFSVFLHFLRHNLSHVSAVTERATDKISIVCTSFNACWLSIGNGGVQMLFVPRQIAARLLSRKPLARNIYCHSMPLFINENSARHLHAMWSMCLIIFLLLSHFARWSLFKRSMNMLCGKYASRYKKRFYYERLRIYDANTGNNWEYV